MNTLPIEIIHKIQLYAIDVAPAKLIYNLQQEIEKKLYQYPDFYKSFKESWDGKGVWNFQCVVLNEICSLLELA